MYDQDIIEKRPSSPIATSLLAAALVAGIASCVLMGMKVRHYTYKTGASPLVSGEMFYKKEFAGTKDKLESMVKAK